MRLGLPLFALAAGLLWAGCAGAGRGYPVQRLDGAQTRLRATAETKGWVFVYLGVECPIANRCLPELMALEREFAGEGVRFCYVYPNPDETPEAIRRHQADYGLTGETFRDPGLRLARQLGASKTPEAVFLDAAGKLIYRGRINDQFLALGQGKPAPTRRDLAEALAQFRAGHPPVGLVQAPVGCTFRSLP